MAGIGLGWRQPILLINTTPPPTITPAAITPPAIPKIGSRGKLSSFWSGKGGGEAGKGGGEAGKGGGISGEWGGLDGEILQKTVPLIDW